MHFTVWMDHYGYIVLFLTLMLELIAFGIPTEVLMSYAGFEVYQGRMGWIPAILAAGCGSSIGISLAYWIGWRLGYPFFHKYGHRIHMGPERLDKFSGWFGKYGNGLLIVAFFIPGVRHITGYFSGITKLSFRKFAAFAYLGAFLWVSAFISLGRLFGPQWQTFHVAAKKYLLIGGVAVVGILALIYVYRQFKVRIFDSLQTVMTESSLRARISIIGSALVFVTLVVWMIGMIQDYLGNEDNEFNTLTGLVVHAVFAGGSAPWMTGFAYLSSPKLLIPLAFAVLVWIVFRERNRLLETVFFIVVVLGGALLEEGLQFLFGRVGPGHAMTAAGLPAAFPSEQSLTSLTVWGFFAYLLIRQAKGVLLPLACMGTVLLIAFLLGISRIYFGEQTPSDIVAGYVFAGVWLSLNITLLDILRELRKVRGPSEAQPR